MSDPLAERARRRLYGEPVVNQPASVVVRRARLGETEMQRRDEGWPAGAAGTSEVAAKFAAATKKHAPGQA